MFDEHLEGQGGSILEKYTDNLTQLAANNEIDPVIGRNDEIESINGKFSVLSNIAHKREYFYERKFIRKLL